MGVCHSSKSVTGPMDVAPIHVNDKHFKDAIVIGCGSFGTVSVIRCTFSTELYAMKRIPKRRLFRKRNHSKLVWGERNALIMCTSPFVVPLYYSFQNNTDLVLVMPFYSGGDLKYLVKTKGLTPLPDLRIYMAELILGLEAMHERHYCHRDLKPENVLIGNDGHVALTDFGLAVLIKPDEPNDRTRHWGQCGTFGYRAPEVVEDLVCGFPSDVYGLAVVFYYMYFGVLPFKRTQYLIDGQPLKFPPIPERKVESPDDTVALFDLLNKMLELMGEWRSTLAQCKAHAFFEGLDWGLAEHKGLRPPFVPSQTEANFFRVDPKKIPANDARDLNHVLTPDHQGCFVGFEFNMSHPHEGGLEAQLSLPELALQPLFALGTPATTTRTAVYGHSAVTGDLITPKATPKTLAHHHLSGPLPGSTERIMLTEKKPPTQAHLVVPSPGHRSPQERTARRLPAAAGAAGASTQQAVVPESPSAVASAMDRLMAGDRDYREQKYKGLSS